MDATATSTTVRCSSLVHHLSANSIINDRFSRPFLISTPPHMSCSPSNFLSPLNFLHPKHRFQNDGFVSWCSPVDSTTSSSSSDPIAVLLEVDGVLMDAYQSGNRQAFNVAFRKLGLDCANWTEPIYSDLLRRGDGNEERMLALFFNKIGWPTSLPTSEKDTFMKSVLQEKKKALADVLMSKDTPLRPGVEQFIDDACDDGICVIILVASSKIGEETARAIVEKLGLERMSKVKIVGRKEIENSSYGQLQRGLEKFSGLSEELANEASKAAAAEKRRIAEEVASMLKVHVNMNTGTTESVREIVAALRTGVEIADVPVWNCVLVAGSQLTVSAAETIGLPFIFLRSRLTSRAEFPSAVPVMDGFGNAYLTVSKLRSKLASSFKR